MKLFPATNFDVELSEDHSTALENLKANTDLSDVLVSNWTKKAFRGQVNKSGFKIISNEIGRGATCVLVGEFELNVGTLQVRIHNAFKILFSVILSYPFIGLGVITFNQGFENAIDFLPILLVYLVVIRVFIGLLFHFVSKTGLNKLTKILGITKLTKTRHNNG